MDKEQIVKETEEYMKTNIPEMRLTTDGSSDFYLRHVLGARKYALQLAERYNADKFIVEMAALLHDIGANAGRVHAHESAKMSREYLAKYDIPKDIIEKIIKCIERHSIGSEVESIEEQIIQDADGIIFIEDTYKDYLDHGLKNHTVEESKKFSIKKTKEMLNKIKTEEGRKIANELLPKALEYLENYSE